MRLNCSWLCEHRLESPVDAWQLETTAEAVSSPEKTALSPLDLLPENRKTIGVEGPGAPTPANLEGPSTVRTCFE